MLCRCRSHRVGIDPNHPIALVKKKRKVGEQMNRPIMRLTQGVVAEQEEQERYLLLAFIIYNAEE
jgi:hypothetical protein